MVYCRPVTLLAAGRVSVVFADKVASTTLLPERVVFELTL